MTPQKKNALLKTLIENALDFLTKSISDLELFPKYSVINFYSAVELLVKARLLAEHWSLVVSKKQDADLAGFLSGDFQSVTLDEAAMRLQKAVGSALTDQEIKSFRNVRKHRNKMVHFFHEADSIEATDELRRAVAKEQLTAWYLLHRLLTTRWQDIFSPWMQSIADADSALRKHHIFLAIIFEHLKADISQREVRGQSIETCPSCGFDSCVHDKDLKKIYESACLVCGLTSVCLLLPCKECESVVRFVNEGYSSCTSCKNSMEPDDVTEALVDTAAAHVAAMEADSSWDLGNCADCEDYHTVVRTRDHTYFCANCFQAFERLSMCGWCNERNTGDMEYSYYKGCSQCEGKAGWERGE